MKTGTTVRLIQPEIRGMVKERRINPTTDELELRIEWVEQEGGEPVSRWFDADALQEVTP